jgi:hypothetical protein
MRMPLTILTAYGTLSFMRYYLKPQDKDSKEKLMAWKGIKSVVPYDGYLGIAGLPFKMTPGAMLKVAYWAQNQLSYQRAEEAISQIMGVKVNDDTVRSVTDFVGRIVFDGDCRKAEEAMDELNSGKLRFPKDREGVLYIQTDGAALNTRSEDEAGSTWRENKLGEVFSSRDIRRWTDGKGKRQHRILGREYVSYIGAASEFKKHLLALALRNGYGRFKETVILSDGAAWIRNVVEELFPDACHILDYFHLCENVTTYAKHVFKMDEEKYRPWAKEICFKLKKSQFRQVLDELRPYKDNLPGTCPVNLFGYITNNVDHIDYAEYEKRGYFIGSGAIESGNKLILQDRLKRAGMRWNPSTAQFLLTLKSKAESNSWVPDVKIPFLSHCRSLSTLL